MQASFHKKLLTAYGQRQILFALETATAVTHTTHQEGNKRGV